MIVGAEKIEIETHSFLAALFERWA